MSEIMRPMPFGQLMRWALQEYRDQGSVFGIRKEKFYKNTRGTGIRIFGADISSPIGPAAGPNSQLAQNIVAAYFAGSRFMELKTVQKMDGEELRACVPRPCINAQDEGYNVEWSTELTVPQAFEEYVKAWVAIHALAKEFGVSDTTDFVFNMSVGYDLEGIQLPKIDAYIEGMKNAAETDIYKQSIGWLREHLDCFACVSEDFVRAIPSTVSNSVTLSTLHGCPPDEIERIARYLMDAKNVHTFVKCNPTLLGYETARGLLDEMGYGYISFDDHHFKDDLQYGDAVAMLKRLLALAGEKSLSFGVKITNTFPVQITRRELPGEEMYMSGRALFVLSINVAGKLARDFEGKLPISYSGGADAFNIEEIFKTGIQPITVATTILKPGGYERMQQLANLLEPLMQGERKGIDVNALESLVGQVAQKAPYRKETRSVASRKTQVPMPLFDCFQAPCKNGGCPIEQQIPEYLRLISEERYEEAFRVIAIDNAVPGVTGEICNHACQGKCTRIDYDTSLEIRNAKRLASEAAQRRYIDQIQPPALKTDKKAVVVGAGPAGIAAALFLRRNGVAVTVLEKRDTPFGIVGHVIPAFRISAEAMARDFEMAKAMGAEFRFNTDVTDIDSLNNQYDFVIIATGAWKECAPAVEEGQEHVLDALDFLQYSKASNCNVELGKQVAVIGGGDVAMDCARAAKRAPGVDKVTLVYRRTREFMPAEPEEIRLALEDGVEMIELRAPKTYTNNTLCCEEMILGDYDASGRRSISGTGQLHDLSFDSVICAVGARVDDTLFNAAGIARDERGRPTLKESCESSREGIYVAGDCRKGPSTVVSAVADAKAIVKDILNTLGIAHDFTRVDGSLPVETLAARKGVLAAATKTSSDGTRCLGCDALCEICCDVCPNRANIAVPMDGFADCAQILHVDGLCNECGNCGIFCPHMGAPYKNKVTLFWTEEDFRESPVNRGFYKMADNSYLLRLEDGSEVNCALDDSRVPAQLRALIQKVEADLPYLMG